MAPSSLLVLVLSLVLLLALPARPGKVAEILQKGRERELRDGASGEAHGAARGAGSAAAWEMRDGAWQAVDEACVAALYAELRYPRDAAECREAGAHLGGAASAARHELQWRSHTCVQSQGLSLAAAPGATNESAKAALRASEEVLNKPKMQAYREWPLGSDVAARPAGGCDGLSARQRGTFSAAEAVEFSSIVESVRAGRWVRLASIEPTSQFVLMHAGSRGTAGRKVESAHIVERFFNGHRWVFLRHSLLPAMGSMASIFCHSSRLYAVNTLGQLWERTRTAVDELEWAQLHFMPHLDAAAPPVLSGRYRSASVFLLDVFGQLVDLRGFGCAACGDTGDNLGDFLGQRLRPHVYSYNSNRAAPDPSLAQLRYWKTSGISGTLPGEPAPSEWWADRVAERPVAIADAETLEPNLVFLIGEFGSLIEVQLTQRFGRAQYRNLGHPARRPLAPVAGIALKRDNNERDKRGPSRSLVLLALSGEVVEYRIPAAPGPGAAEPPEWLVVGYPEPGLSVVAIGPAIVSNMFPGDPPLVQELSLLFCVGADGRVYELSRVRKDSWTWQEHFHPGFGGAVEPGPSPWYNRLEGVPGVKAALFSPVWLTKDNSLAIKVPRSPTEWNWKVIELPEVGSAKWCSPDPSAPDSCMPKPPDDDDDFGNFDVIW